ncbi:MAG: isocitrate lyase/phosphoenolpyruvate mutase family protein [Pseudomonadota bacterium]
MTPTEKGETFRALHQSGCFILPNPWDIGSARVLAALGAPALATTSAGFAFTRGLPDGGHLSRDEMLAHAEEIVAATPLPVSADLENGYADAPDAVAETVRLAAGTGLAGCSIEDTDLTNGGAYEFDLTVERIRAAVDAARGAPHPFTLTARADGVMVGAYDTDEAVRRLQAFEAAGADVLYAPFLPDMAAVARVCTSVSLPVNALCAGRFTRETKDAFAAAGVRRISLGSSLASITQRAIVEATKAMFEAGDFSALQSGMRGSEVAALLESGAP